jgi:hypothetical protein
MTYEMKPLACDPARIKGMSERLIVSHRENNYGGAVKRLNLIIRSAGVVALILLGLLSPGLARHAAARPAQPLVLEQKIALGEVGGRIDHLAVDLARNRLFVAELGNNSLGVVDLAAGKLLRRIGDLDEPQGVAYDLATDTVYVADGGDGLVHRFKGAELRPLDPIQLDADADNVRLDPEASRVVVGYGDGALALIDGLRQTNN